MKLLYTPTSPYARKVRCVVRAKGLLPRVQEEVCDPFSDVPELRHANPLSLVPTLLRDTAAPLFDSRVICAYLDSLAATPQLIPPSGELRWQVLRLEALADGITDVAYSIVMERKRPAAQQSAQWLGQWQQEIGRALDYLDADPQQLPSAASLAQIALVVACGYIEFRLADLQWQTGRENLHDWYRAQWLQHPEFAATAPA